ncbi:MAG TPA: alpha/beta hydrolase [Acidimicrobiales bacterium]|nr:alpha/beta hydrolase [Acidimicrobiales bacterium]
MAIVAAMLRSLPGGSLFGESWGGEGPPAVVALHGWGRSHADFAGVFGPGAGRQAPPVLGPDLPGFGATPPPPEPWGSAEYARVVAAMVEAACGPGAAPVVLLGHSFGGRVAVTLAAARPDLVGGLVLTGVPLVRRPGARRRPPVGYRLVRGLRRLGLVGEERLERARRHHGSADYRNAEGVMRGVLVRLLGEDYRPALVALRCPLELVWGDDDAEVPLSVAEAAAALVPGATLTVFAGAGHLTPLSVPGPLRQAVDRVLQAAGT